jgi:hypothetical protein
MDAIEGALKLLDLLERDQLAELESCASALRASKVALKEDGLELLERAIALDRAEAVRSLLRLGISGRPDVLFGAWCHGALNRLAERCLALGRIPILLELLACGATVPVLHHDDEDGGSDRPRSYRRVCAG